jgi:hypothetical protein
MCHGTALRLNTGNCYCVADSKNVGLPIVGQVRSECEMEVGTVGAVLPKLNREKRRAVHQTRLRRTRNDVVTSLE